MQKDDIATKGELEEMFKKFGESISDKIAEKVIIKIKPTIKETIHEEFTQNSFKITPLASATRP